MLTGSGNRDSRSAVGTLFMEHRVSVAKFARVCVGLHLYHDA